MFHNPFLLALTICTVSLASATADLPVIFIHGVLGNYQDGDNFVANLTAQPSPSSFATTHAPSNRS